MKTNIITIVQVLLLRSLTHKDGLKTQQQGLEKYSEFKAKRVSPQGLGLQEIFPKETHKIMAAVLENISEII